MKHNKLRLLDSGAIVSSACLRGCSLLSAISSNVASHDDDFDSSSIH